MPNQHAHDLLVLGEDGEFLNDSNRFHLTHSEVQKMIRFSMLRYEEITLRRLMIGVIQNITETLLEAAAKGETIESSSPTYYAVEKVPKHAVNPSIADKVMSSRRDRLADPQKRT